MSILFQLRARQELDILEVGETLGLDLNKLLEFVHMNDMTASHRTDEDHSCSSGLRQP